MPANEFLAWCEGREGERWELVRGVPVRMAPMDMMAGARRRHDQIVTNILTALRNRLRGKACRPYTADFAMRTDADNSVRRPDVLVDCAPGRPDDLAAERPTAAFEILSPSNANFTKFEKVEEYKGVDTLRHVVIVDVDAQRLMVHSRGNLNSWQSIEIEGASGTLALPAIGVEIPISEIYEDVVLGNAKPS
jgi:Uma2 family endonuclease